MKTPNFKFKSEDLDKPLTVRLLFEYWENYLLPRLAEMFEKSRLSMFEKMKIENETLTNNNQLIKK